MMKTDVEGIFPDIDPKYAFFGLAAANTVSTAVVGRVFSAISLTGGAIFGAVHFGVAMGTSVLKKYIVEKDSKDLLNTILKISVLIIDFFGSYLVPYFTVNMLGYSLSMLTSIGLITVTTALAGTVSGIALIAYKFLSK